MQVLRNLTVVGGLSLLVGGAAFGDQANQNGGQIIPISAIANGKEQSFNAYLTGYSFWDNTPPGSAAIARPVIHRQAGGSGSYNDPVTIAVGHSIVGGKQTLDFHAGTRFYIGSLQKYAIVEDVCGDGPTPQSGPCHSGRNGLPWLDIYVGGQNTSPETANACMRQITAVHTFIVNPRAGYPVVAGELANDCRLLSS